MRWHSLIAALLLSLVGEAGAGVAAAQDLDKAIQAYNDDKNAEAAALFYEVLTEAKDPEAVVKAEYYVAQALFKSGFLLPAMHHYGEVFASGHEHPYFLKATAGLLNLSDALKDDMLIPTIIDKGYSSAFARLKSEELNAINHHMGMIAQRSGNDAEAAQFLLAVTRPPFYSKARYRLAIIAVKSAEKEKKSESIAEAIRYFGEIELGERANAGSALARLATLGKARAYYAEGSYAKSAAHFEQVPSADAILGAGWARLMMGEPQRALQSAESAQQRGLGEPARAESLWLKTVALARLCELDRAKETRDQFLRTYEPMSAQLKTFLGPKLSDAQVVESLVKGDAKLPAEIRNPITANHRIENFLGILREIDTEMERTKTAFANAPFKKYLTDLLRDHKTQRTNLTGKLVRSQIQQEKAFLDDWLTTMRAFDVEATKGACASGVAPAKGGVATRPAYKLRANFLPELFDSLDEL